MKKRILSILLLVSMLTTMLPTTAFATENVSSEDIQTVCTQDESCLAETHEDACPMAEETETLDVVDNTDVSSDVPGTELPENANVSDANVPMETPDLPADKEPESEPQNETVEWSKLIPATNSIEPFAAGPITNEETLKAALADETQTTIDFIGNIVLSEPIKITRPVTIDGRGCVISPEKGNTSGLFIVQSTGELTLSDITLDGEKQCGSLLKTDAGKLILSDAVIENGTADLGAGIFIGQGTVAELTNVLIRNNTAQTSGGGMIIANDATVEMTDCRITKNTIKAPSESNGAGITCGGVLTMINGRIDHNTGAWYGGGLYVNPNGQADLKHTAVYENDVSGWDSQVNDSQGSDIYKTDNPNSTLKFNNPSEWPLTVIGAENWYLDYASRRYPAYHIVAGATEYNGGDAFVGTVGTIHTVTFDANRGILADGNSSHEVLVWEDETVSPTKYFEITEENVPSNPTRNKYKFCGWYDEQGKLLDPYKPVTEDKTYTAKWVENTKNVLYFVTNGGSPVAPVAVEPNTEIDLKQYNTIREGLVFAGWHLDQALTGSALDTIKMDQDYTVYAKWTEGTVNVTYDPNGGQWSDGGSSAAKTVAIPTGTNAENLKNLTLAGKRLEGWSTSPKGTPLFDFSNPISQNITLYAVWKDADMVTVTFDSNGGLWNHVYNHFYDQKQKIYRDRKPGTKIAAKDILHCPGVGEAVSRFDREHYHHLGWSTDPNAADPEIAADQEFIVPDHDATYYAVWRTARGTIRFLGAPRNMWTDPPVRGNTPEMKDVAYDTDLTLTPNGFTQWGHEFSHWSTKWGYDQYYPTYKDQAPAKGLIKNEDDVLELTATFKPAMMNVTYDLEGVTIAENQLGKEILYGSSVDRKRIYISAKTGFVIDTWRNVPRVNIYSTTENGSKSQINNEIKYDRDIDQYYIALEGSVRGPVTVQIKAPPIRYSVTFQASTSQWSKPAWIWYPRYEEYLGEITYEIPYGKSLNDLKEEMIKVGNMSFPTLDAGKWIDSKNHETVLEEIWNKKFYADETYTLQTKKSSQVAVRFYLEGGTTTAENDGVYGAPYILIDPPETGTKKLSEYAAYQKFTSIAPEKTDSEFGGWFNSQNPSSNKENAGRIEITSDKAGKFINVYAYWGSVCKVVFHSNGGTGGPQNVAFPLKKDYPSQTTKDINDDVWDALQNAEAPQKEKHKLIGWSYQKYTDDVPLFLAHRISSFDSDVIIEQYDRHEISIDKSVTVDVYAVWCRMDDMILRFNTHGGTPEYSERHADPAFFFTGFGENSDSEMADALAGLSIPKNDPSREGYIFKGWYWSYEDIVLDGKEHLLKLQKSYAPGSVEYGYIRENIATLDIYVEMFNQMRQDAIDKCKPGEDVDEAVWNTFVEKHYIQIMDPTAETPFDAAITVLYIYAPVTGQYDLTLHAKWIPDPKYVDVKFLPGEHGTLSGNDVFRIEKDTTMQSKGYTVPSVDENRGYQFTGWADQNGKTYTNEEVLTLSMIGGMTFTAQYEVAPEIPIFIRPENQTIYTGGADGDPDNIEFPQPIYLMNEQDSQPTVLGDDMKFFVNGQLWENTIHPLPFKVKYYDAAGKEITSDETYGDFVSRIVPLIDGAEIETEDGKIVQFANGTLRIRYVSDYEDASKNDILTDAIEYTAESKDELRTQVEETGQVGILIPEETTLYLNGKTEYAYPENYSGQIALLVDELLPSTPDGSNQVYIDKLMTHAKEQGFDLKQKQSMFRYLDLVDKNDANVWVASSMGCEMFLPYPEGTDRKDTFQLLRFDGINREYGMKGEKSLDEQIQDSTIEKFDVTKTDAGLWLHVNAQGSAPWALTWDKYTGGGSSGGGGSSSSRYTLHYESNGGTEYKDERYDRNTVVKLDKSPSREGHSFTGWYADKELTKRITEVKMTSNKTVYAGWDATEIPEWLNGKDHFAYVVGYEDGTVHPMDNISRAEVATIFFRLLNEDIREENLTDTNNFVDVSEGMWCNTEISTMAKLGIIKGRSPEEFAPNAPITRAEFAAICARFDTSKNDGDSVFTDISGHWAEDEIERAATLGWIMGYTDKTFRPQNFIKRAEAMAMINRVLHRLPENEDDLLDGMNVWPDNKPGTWYYLAVQEATNSHDFTRKGDVYEHWIKLTADPDWSQYR